MPAQDRHNLSPVTVPTRASVNPTTAASRWEEVTRGVRVWSTTAPHTPGEVVDAGA